MFHIFRNWLDKSIIQRSNITSKQWEEAFATLLLLNRLSAFTTGFEDFHQKCSRGNSIGIDCYAENSPAEYFAVLSEVFFKRPDILFKLYEAIYTNLRQYFRQDPLSQMSVK